MLVCSAHRTALASTTRADTLVVSTISSLAGGNGISFTSFTHLATGMSLTLQGASGYISGASSITASAFFGDGTNLTNLSIPFDYSGETIFTSSFSVLSNGLEIILSTSDSTANLDISPTGSISFYPELHNSSSTALLEYSTSVSSWGPCVAGSTLTITTTGGKIEAFFTGDLYNTSPTAGANAGVTFLLDGQFVGDLSSINGFSNGSNNGNDYSFSLDYLIAAPAPGMHSVCVSLSARLGIGTATLTDSLAGNIFYIEEIK